MFRIVDFQLTFSSYRGNIAQLGDTEDTEEDDRERMFYEKFDELYTYVYLRHTTPLYDEGYDIPECIDKHENSSGDDIYQEDESGFLHQSTD